MACIDHKNDYDMAPQSWILHCLKMYKIPDQIIEFIEKTMQTQRAELTAGEKKLRRGKDPKRHIQGRCNIVITICESHDVIQPHS